MKTVSLHIIWTHFKATAYQGAAAWCITIMNRYHHTAGYTDTENKPTELDTTYWLYSATKLVTCTAVMQLVERGLISWMIRLTSTFRVRKFDGKYETEQTGTKQDDNQASDVYQSGLNYNINTPSLTKAVKDSNGQISTREFIRALSQEPLDFEPGTRFQYSLSHDVLGALVEAVSGMSFDQYLDKSIFMPLNMSNTGFELTADRRALMSQQYRYDVLSDCETNPHGKRVCLSPNYKSGGAGHISTVQISYCFWMLYQWRSSIQWQSDYRSRIH